MIDDLDAILNEDGFEVHFQSWLDNHVRDDERDDVEAGMRAYVTKYPETIKEYNWSWTEVRTVAERENYIPLRQHTILN